MAGPDILAIDNPDFRYLSLTRVSNPVPLRAAPVRLTLTGPSSSSIVLIRYLMALMEAQSDCPIICPQDLADQTLRATSLVPF